MSTRDFVTKGKRGLDDHEKGCEIFAKGKIDKRAEG